MKTTLRSYFTPIRMAVIKITVSTNVDEDLGKKIYLHTLLVGTKIRRSTMEAPQNTKN
jgi:hypothetical protein